MLTAIHEQLNEFWDTTKEVWENGLYGVDIGHILTAIGIFLIFLIIRGLFTRFVLHELHNFTDKTETEIDDKIIEALRDPIRFIPIVLGLFFSFNYLNLPEEVDPFIQNAMKSLITFTIFWALFKALEPLSYVLTSLRKVLTPTMVNWIFRLLKVLTVFLGSAVILELWGIKIGPLLAGLGLFGAAVALGAQDVFKNLIGGITVIAEKRFYPGDWIKVEGVVEGVVEEIGFRSTMIRRFDKAPVHVPNSQLSDVAVTNFSRMSHRRIYWVIGVEYRTSVEQLKIIRDGILAYIKQDDRFAPEETVPTFVRVDSFNNSSIDIMVYCFTKTTVWGEWLEIKEDFALAIKEIVEEKAGAGFAFPSQSIYIESLPQDAPEPFTPPKD